MRRLLLVALAALAFAAPASASPVLASGIQDDAWLRYDYSGSLTERVLKLMQDASALTHLTKDDAPVFMVYTAGDTPVTANSDWVHHIRLGQKLKEAMNKLGLECTVTERGYDPMREFLIRELKKEK